jgi:hypothetical protein
MGFPGNYKSKFDFGKKSSSGPYSAQGHVATAWIKGKNGPAVPTSGVAPVHARGGHRAPGACGGTTTGGQPAGKEAHRRWPRHRGASRSSSGTEKKTMGSPSGVSTVRWLGWRCATAAAVSGELWWWATTLAMLHSSRRMGCH